MIALAKQGKKVLIVDVDPQSNLTTYAGWYNNDEKIIKQFEKTYKHHIDVIDINMSGICEKCLEKKAA